MTLEKAIKTLRFQLSKSPLSVGPGLKEAIREGIIALQEKQLEKERGAK